MANFEIPRMSDGAIRAFTSVGAYPLFYLTTDDRPVCPSCVEEHLEECTVDGGYYELAGVHVNWETHDLPCEICQENIEAAYEPIEEDTNG